MEKRLLGNSGIAVMPLAFGGNVFGWTIDEKTSFELLDAFIAAGFNFIDTADVYSRWAPGNKGGESETIIGKWVHKSNNRNKVVIATKVGKEMAPDKKGLSKKYIIDAVEASLQRLQTDYIDLYQSHDEDTATPLEETLEAYHQLIQQGKVRAIGASNYNAARLAEALRVSKQLQLPRYDTLQPLYNLYDREVFEKELEPLCLEHNVGVINYFALASGFLTGKYRSETDLNKSIRGQGNKKYLNDRGFAILHALDAVAAQYSATPAQVAIAWLIARKSVTAPIASATNLEQLQDLIKAASLQLNAEAITLLDRASAW
ncbi:aldo/keto reductase [Russula earlei]|uniref:Aldo/keto reductase n=1 Tax=Russula earlei TaxID=71964 RepID=A0ACC0TQ96_9AGAM|nr:aldo/keto reductase [Russula earlei]